MTAAVAPVVKLPASARKPTRAAKPLEWFEARFRLTRPGGWSPGSGLMHSTYETAHEERVMVASPRHLYAPHLGRDIYPTAEQLAQLRAGQEVVFHLSQWA